MAEGTASGMDPLVELSNCLEQARYPQSRAGLLSHARACGLSPAAQALLHQFPDWEFASPQQAIQALSEVELSD